jgi:2-aminoadipate transaminase
MTTTQDSWFSRLAERAQAGPSELSAVLALAASGGDLVDFSGGFPDPGLFDTQLLAQTSAKVIETRPEVALQYASNLGLPGLREALREDVSRTQAVTPAEDELIVTSGGVDGLTMISKAMLDAGDGVLVEAPSYLGAFSVFRTHEGVCLSMRNDEHGLIPESVIDVVEDARVRSITPKLVYVIPDFQNPSGLRLSEERRIRLVEICRRLGLLIVEDVAYRDLAFDGSCTRSLYELGPDVTVQLGTFSKTFTPGTRLGWACGPATVIDALAQAKTNTDQCAGALGQCILEAMIREGHYVEALPRLRAGYAERAQALLSALDAELVGRATWTVPEGGFFTWLDVPDVDTRALAAVAVDSGVAFVPGAPFFADPVVSPNLRLSFSRTSPDRMAEGVRRLARSIDQVRQR